MRALSYKTRVIETQGRGELNCRAKKAHGKKKKGNNGGKSKIGRGGRDGQEGVEWEGRGKRENKYLYMYKACLFRLYQTFQGSGKKNSITVIVYILPHMPVTPAGGWDKGRIYFQTLESSDTILKKTVYRNVGV